GQRVERVVQVDEGRVGERHEAGQLLDRLAERRLLRGERFGRGAEVLDQRGEVRLARRDRPEQLARLGDEAREVATVVPVELLEEGAAGGDGGVQVLPGRLRLGALAGELGGRPLDQVLNALQGRRVERVEQLV